MSYGTSFRPDPVVTGLLPRRRIAPVPSRIDLTRDALPVLAHELRGPLAALLVSTEVLIEHIDTLDRPTIQSMLQTLRRQALLMQTIMENFLCTGAIDQGCFFLRPEALQLTDLADEIREMLSPLFERQGQLMLLDSSPSLPPVEADRQRISQLMLNLLFNASKFSDAGEIVIKLAEREGYVRVTVADRGPGIPPAEREAVFRRSYRLTSSDRPRTEGLGLGLFIAQAIVDAHGGHIGISGRRHGGTRCWFELPISNSEC